MSSAAHLTAFSLATVLKAFRFPQGFDNFRRALALECPPGQVSLSPLLGLSAGPQVTSQEVAKAANPWKGLLGFPWGLVGPLATLMV